MNPNSINLRNIFLPSNLFTFPKEILTTFDFVLRVSKRQFRINQLLLFYVYWYFKSNIKNISSDLQQIFRNHFHSTYHTAYFMQQLAIAHCFRLLLYLANFAFYAESMLNKLCSYECCT